MQRNKVLRFAQGFLVPIVLLILWEVAARNGWVKSSITSSPTAIASALWNWIQKGTLFTNVAISLWRALLGFVIGSGAGILLGIALGLSQRAYTLLRVVVGILRPIPLIAWIPIMIILAGIGEVSKLIVISIGTFWPLFLNTYDGIRGVDVKYLEVATILRKGRGETIARVVLPAAVPHIFTGLKLASGNALMGVVGAEMFAASSGIGFLVTYAKDLGQPGKMFAGVFVIALLGWILNLIVEHVETKIAK